MAKLNIYFQLFMTVLLICYAQLIVKWRVEISGIKALSFQGKMKGIFTLFLDPWMISCLLAGVLTLVLWMMVLSQAELSYAYPVLVAGLFIVIGICSVLFFNEPLTWEKVVSLVFILTGIIIGSIKSISM